MITKRVVNNNFMLTIVIVTAILLSLFIGMRMVHASERVEYEKAFISIEIAPGETLMSIAEDYAAGSSNYNDYIDEVKEINNLENDTIHAGCYLMIPVYHTVE